MSLQIKASENWNDLYLSVSYLLAPLNWTNSKLESKHSAFPPHSQKNSFSSSRFLSYNPPRKSETRWKVHTFQMSISQAPNGVFQKLGLSYSHSKRATIASEDFWPNLTDISKLLWLWRSETLSILLGLSPSLCTGTLHDPLMVFPQQNAETRFQSLSFIYKT